MTDAEFLAQLTDCSLPKSQFNHQGHVRAAWILLSQHPFDMAEQLMIEAIKRYAASIGASHIYHETMTRAWMRVVKEVMQAPMLGRDCEAQPTFAAFFENNKDSLQKETIFQYYSRERLDCDEARKKWLEPDLKKFQI